jgi:hypothetical protein
MSLFKGQLDQAWVILGQPISSTGGNKTSACRTSLVAGHLR